MQEQASTAQGDEEEEGIAESSAAGTGGKGYDDADTAEEDSNATQQHVWHHDRAKVIMLCHPINCKWLWLKLSYL